MERNGVVRWGEVEDSQVYIGTCTSPHFLPSPLDIKTDWPSIVPKEEEERKQLTNP